MKFRYLELQLLYKYEVPAPVLDVERKNLSIQHTVMHHGINMYHNKVGMIGIPKSITDIMYR